MTFLIGGIFGMDLKGDFLENGTANLPGLDITVSGNAVSEGDRTFTFSGDMINGFVYYNLTYVFLADVDDAEIVIGYELQ
jgi:hypothetical protein